VDNGYDVANYTAIDPAYGTLDDLTSWSPGRTRGIRIVLDMVFNHTSTQHAWFRESLKKRARTASSISGATVHRSSAQQLALKVWRQRLDWHAESEQYYLHLFAGAGGSQLGKPGGARRAEKGLRVLGRSRRRRLTSRRD
jgi:trehalose-6-phosphate hydrolase